METRLTLFACLALCWTSGSANLLPVFTHDMNNLALSESTPVGAIVYRLQGVDPEALPIKYSLVGTDKFSVNAETGDVTLEKALDREVEDTIKFLVSIEEQDPEGGAPGLAQSQPVTVIVTDENDNPPLFTNSPYEVEVGEDAAVGSTVLRGLRVRDRDSVGDSLEVDCVDTEQWPEACSTFEVVTLNASANEYVGALVLRRPLDYNRQQFYQLLLLATDGTLNSTAPVSVQVSDVQNSPPVFTGPLSGALREDAPVGALALTLAARDADRAQPRELHFELITNPLDFFVLDGVTGELRTAKPLDREALPDPASPLNLTVRATEIVDGSPLVSALTSSLGTVTLTIQDVNDEPPRFNAREYAVRVPESLPPAAPLPNLDMLVTDTDLGLNSVFTLRLSNGFGLFVVEPAQASGSARVTLRLNASLDYEDPNQRKFILEVIAEEVHTSPRLSSRASVTVSVTDVNDNAPSFPADPPSARVPEASPAGARVAALAATDRDTGRFGTAGIIYELSGNGADLFTVDKRSGVISVAPCETPGQPPCLDYETRKDYFLQYKATDDDGAGLSTAAPLQISLTDSNDNAPVCSTPVYKASIDEDATKFEPDLQVQARDVDATSEIRYSVVAPAAPEFWIDPLSGRVGVRPARAALRANDTRVVLTVLATDGVHNATCRVEILVRDVNNHAPAFDTDRYDADIAEDAPIGTEVAAVRATDLDSGVNAELKYTIQKGALDSFSIDNVSGVVSVASKLDYDKRNTYRIQIVATDSGIPHQTGTTELTVHVINVNDKPPVFTPATQRADVSADAPPGTEIHVLAAMDPDILDPRDLSFERDLTRPVKAVDRNGKEVTEEGIFDSWFVVLGNGSVAVAQRADRARAAVLALPVAVTDTSAQMQRAQGELIITIVEVNRHAPVFSEPAYHVTLAEEQPVGTTLGTFPATDRETPIAAIVIDPPSEYFTVDSATGTVKSRKRIDYEQIKQINFTLRAYDSGVPQRAASAGVAVRVANVDDEEPAFAAEAYAAAVHEGAPPGTRVVTVTAIDKDEGEFGEVSYSLSGENASLFSIDPRSGVVAVAAELDREATPDLYLRAVATDNAPPDLRRSTSVPVHIKVRDVNDNPPAFSQQVYKGSISENLPLRPPAAILQLRAEDPDEGLHGAVAYAIDHQPEPGVFTVDPSSGIIYPSKPVVGNTTYTLTVSARDGAGSGPHAATARVDIFVLSVNKHSPVFVQPPADVRQITIPENAAQANYLVTTIQATDEDSGENGRISYYLKVDNQNVGETAEFSLDKDSGELRTKTFLDREHKAEYQLVVAAVDNGTPAQFSSLRLLGVVLADDDDNAPRFPRPRYTFSVPENQPPHTTVGTVKATDKDSGENGKVYYHILEGNQERAFTLDRLQGTIHSNISFDREKQSEYTFTVYASNSPLFSPAEALNSVDNGTDSVECVTSVTVHVLDENDNAPAFPQAVYYAGIKHTARINEPIISVVASDPDLEENGTLVYVVAASNLYKFGASQSSGSVVPSPFNISQDGVVMTAQYMSEYHQDRFVLDIVARESAPPHRQAKAQLYIWIIDRSSLIRMVVSRSCAAPAEEVRAQLAQAGGALLVPGRRRPLVHAGDKYDDWCEMELHAVEAGSWRVLGVRRVLQRIDAHYDRLRAAYAAHGVESLQPLAADDRAAETFDPALAALIALLIVLFTGIITFAVVCACLKHWVIPPASLQSSKGDSLARRRILEELATTENPLWLDAKLRPYEEQELTMNVFGDLADPRAPDDAQPDNTYATIQGSRPTERFGDYATLGGDSPTPMEAALGFQGSTFKPPSADTPEPPPRPSALANL